MTEIFVEWGEKTPTEESQKEQLERSKEKWERTSYNPRKREVSRGEEWLVIPNTEMSV